MKKKKTGRPPRGEVRDDLVHVGFKADPETLTAIRFLTAVMQRQSGTLPSQSVVIRHYLIEAARQLSEKASVSESMSLLAVDDSLAEARSSTRADTSSKKRGKKT